MDRRWVVRYTRWQDRLRARMSPAKRRQLRMAQTMVDGPVGDEISRRVDIGITDLALYGAHYVDSDGKRIDPREIHGWPSL